MIEKKHLYQVCLSNIENRIQTAEEALEAAIAAGNDETKSSVGDKFETGRAMMHMEQEKNHDLLMKTIALKNNLIQIDINKKCEKVEHGAVVITDSGRYYISTSVGKIIFNGETYYAISMDAPLSKAMLGKKENDHFLFKDRKIVILKIE